METKPGYNMSFGEPCARCALRAICDGVDRDYVAAHGWSEFEPYPGPPVTDLLHFRRAYAPAFRMPGGAPAPVVPVAADAEGAA